MLLFKVPDNFTVDFKCVIKIYNIAPITQFTYTKNSDKYDSVTIRVIHSTVKIVLQQKRIDVIRNVDLTFNCVD